MSYYLVTGASGYIASWIVRYLLEQGHNVNGTVRNPGDPRKTSHLLEMQKKHPGQLRLFEADLLAREGFRAAMEGCETVIHTASPFIIEKIRNAEKQLIGPAVKGTENVLSLAGEYSLVRKIVLTSSVAAVHGDAADIRSASGGVFTGEDWNLSSSPEYNPYQYSKRLAEETAWGICKSQHRWKLAVINPGLVLGPSLSLHSDSASLGMMKDLLTGRYRSGVPPFYFGVVDVRDVAMAHIVAAQQPGAEGRHICVGEVASLLDMAGLIREEFPGLPLPKKELGKWLFRAVAPFLGISQRFISRNYGITYAYDTGKSRESLGLSYLPLKKTLIDHANGMLLTRGSGLQHN